MKHLNALTLLALLLYFTVKAPEFINSMPHRMYLIHIDAVSNATDLELFQRALLRSNARASMLAKRSKSTDQVEAPFYFSEGEYLLELFIGMPASPLSAILDTGSDLTWIQCKPCIHCLNQPNPLFDPVNSHSYSKIPCNGTCKALFDHSTCKKKSCIYSIRYQDGSESIGSLSREAFTFGSTTQASVPNIIFGCASKTSGILANGSGVVGFGRGPLSIITQLGVKKFAYCLTSYNSDIKSPLLFDALADIKNSINETDSTHFQSTPLLKTNPLRFYHLSIQGITIGTEHLQIPPSTFEFKANGDGGVIIDSGTLFTYLESRAYRLLKDSFTSQMKLPISNITTSDHYLDLCFSMGSSSREEVEVPKLVLHFDGATMHVPSQNFLYEDVKLGLLCLAVLDGGLFGLSIIGSYLHQNMHVVYDLEHSKLFFASAQCDKM